MANKGIGFWIGLIALISGVLTFLPLGMISGFGAKAAPIAAILAGLFMLIKN
jgi:hypothetical protein